MHCLLWTCINQWKAKGPKIKMYILLMSMMTLYSHRPSESWHSRTGSLEVTLLRSYWADDRIFADIVKPDNSAIMLTGTDWEVLISDECWGVQYTVYYRFRNLIKYIIFSFGKGLIDWLILINFIWGHTKSTIAFSTRWVSTAVKNLTSR